MKVEINTNTLLLIIAVIILCLMYCGKGNTTSSGTRDTISITNTIIKDTTIHSIETHNINYYHKDTVVIPQSTSLDTIAIINDFYTQHFFEDSLKDSIIDARYSGLIWQNNLYAPEFKYKLLKPLTILTNTVVSEPEKKKFKMFFGGFLGAPIGKGTLDNSVSGGIGVSFLTKQEQMGDINYNPFRNEVMLGYKMKISFGKK